MKHRLFLFVLLFAANYVGAQNTQTFYYQGNVFQIFVVPTTGWYFLDASGGQGGAVSGLFCDWPESIQTLCYGGINQGGKGARLQGYVRLEAGDSLRIAVAGAGGNGTIYQNLTISTDDCYNIVASGGGGGGASSIVKVNGSVYTPLLFAAGGGGASYKSQDITVNHNNWEFPYSPDGTGGPGNATIQAGNTFSKNYWLYDTQNHAGINGNGGAGGQEDSGGAGGAGYYTDGWTHYANAGDYEGSLYSYGGQAYLSGNYGGDAGHEGGDGGWGGGGEGGFAYTIISGVCSLPWIASLGTPGGGGGGWNGGAGGGTLSGDPVFCPEPGGGGGSYVAPEVNTTGCLALSGANSGNGIVSITHLPFNNIAPIDTTFAFAGNVFQTFTAPATGYYRITAKGGQGGAVDVAEGGKGALLSGYFLLREGETLQIAAGGAGQNGIQADNTWWSGGGGGGASSVVGLYGQDHRLLLLASGGGGAGYGNWGGPGEATPDVPFSSGRGGVNAGGGAVGDVFSGAGAGFYFDGKTAYLGTNNPSIAAYGGQAYWSGNYGGNAGQAGGDGGWGGGGEGGLPNDGNLYAENAITIHGAGGGAGGFWGGNVVLGLAGFSSYSYSIANCSLSQISGANEGNGSIRIIGPHVAIDTVNTPGPNYTWAANGVSYQHSGTYSYADIDNCIIRVLDLSIGGLGGCLNYTTLDTTITSCGSYTNPLNGRTYTENATDSIRVGCVKYRVQLIVAPPAELLGNMITGGNSQSGMFVCNNSEHTYAISPVPYATSYEWTLPSGATGTSSTNSITVLFGNDFTGGAICVTPINECGSGESICKTIYPTATAPFPTGDVIQISAPQAPHISGNYAATELFGATTYTWSVSNNEAVIVSGQGTPNIQLQASPSITGLTTLSVVAENCLGSQSSASLILVDAVSVEEEEMVMVDDITLYPNPSKGQFTLSTPSLKEDAILEVYSMEGRLVYQKNIPANTKQTFIDLQQPSAGLYAVRLLAGNKLSSMKIIVN